MITIALTPTIARVSGLDKFTRQVITDALSLPTPDGEGKTSLAQRVTANSAPLVGDHCDVTMTFPSTLVRRVMRAFTHQHIGVNVRADYTGPRFARNWCRNNPQIVDPWKLRGGATGYQAEAIDALLNRCGGIAHCPAGSGKTVIASRVVEAVLLAWPEARVLWLGQTHEQVEQAKNALGLNGPQEGRWTPPNMDRFHIDVKCWQGVRDDDDLAQYNVFVGDEVHSSTDSLYAISKRLRNAWWKIGLTATFVRNDSRELLIEAAFGERVVSISAQRVLSEGHLCRGRVTFLPVGSANEIEQLVEEAAAPELEENLRKYRDPDMREQQGRRIMWRYAQKLGIRESKLRNGLAAKAALMGIERGEVILVLVDTKEQGKAIKKLIPDSKFVYAAMPVKEGRRDELVADLNEGRLNCLIATDLANQGLDVPRVTTIIRARSGKGGKDGYLIQQQAARAQRIHGEKQVANIIDFMDQHHPMLHAQSWKRFNEYQKQKFEIELPNNQKRAAAGRNRTAQNDMIGARV